MNPFLEIVLLIVIGFVAGVINTFAGGGSLLTLPVLIFLGLPPNVANATNRIGVFFQSISTTAGFKSKGIKTFPFSIYISISALIGALIGAQIAVDIKGETFNKILAILMVLVVIYMVFNHKYKQFNLLERSTGKHLWLSIFLFFFVGIYGGFIQAGAGFIMLLLLSSINNFSLVKSNAIKVTVTLVFTVASLVIFLANGKINWKYGLLLAIGSAVGGWLASRWSVKKGDGLVKIFMIVMVVFMAIKLWFF
ncbi:MAG: sulfite exporter TauE/SafE family protein [Lutibacter sp.]